MREIKFSCMWTNGVDWMDLRYTLEQMENGEHFDAVDDLPILGDFELKHKRQFTGLKDWNDEDVYEGSILHDNDNGFVFVVFDLATSSFVAKRDRRSIGLNYLVENGSLVVGNIHQNPELLEG